jgi:hypothetical protein
VWRKSSARLTAIDALCEQLIKHHGLS